MTALQVTWFVLIAVLLTGYAVLDGFDLGVGFWHLFAKKDRERRTFLQAIGPVWDGNEVWLLTGGGAIFAAFPPVYATVFSGLYLALMLVLVGLIFRAVSMEFRSKVESPRWRSAWDVAFSLGSIIPALLFGVAVGNILRGLPLDVDGNFTGTFLGLLNPYSLLVGLTGLAMFAAHGAMYLHVKTEGDLAARSRSWARLSHLVFVVLLLASSGWSLASRPWLLDNHLSMPVLMLVPALAFISLAVVQHALARGRGLRAFMASSVTIVCLIATVAVSLFPSIVPAAGDPSLSLTVFDASSSRRTLATMLVLAAIGMPVVILYTIFAYRTFAGKVTVDENGY
jgi:cytochrome d ubiquinol oxidase subunit II